MDTLKNKPIHYADAYNETTYVCDRKNSILYLFHQFLICRHKPADVREFV